MKYIINMVLRLFAGVSSMRLNQDFSNEQIIDQIRTRGDSGGRLTLQLWERNAGIIRKACKKYKGFIDQEDAMQECYFAFVGALNEYDPEGGATFAGFCFDRCRWHLFRYIEECGATVRIPSHERHLITRYKRFVRQWCMNHGEEPDDAVICFNLNIPQDTLDRIRIDMSLMDVGSLDTPISEESDNATIADMVPDGSVNVEDDALESEFIKERARAVWGAVDTLKPVDAEAIRMCYKHGMTYKEAGEAAGVSGPAIRQRIASGMRDLRRGKQYKVLREFVDMSPTYSISIKGGSNTFNNTWTSSTERAALINIRFEEERKAGIERLNAIRREMLIAGHPAK